MRVPLNTLRLGVDELQRGIHRGPDFTFVLRCMDEATSTMSDTLDDVLSYQKIEEGKLDLILKPFNLRDLIEAIHTCFKAEFTAKDIKFVVSLDDTLPGQIVGDRTRIRQVRKNTPQ